MKRRNKNKDQDVGEVIPEPLSFAALDARIRAMPDGPAAVTFPREALEEHRHLRSDPGLTPEHGAAGGAGP